MHHVIDNLEMYFTSTGVTCFGPASLQIDSQARYTPQAVATVLFYWGGPAAGARPPEAWINPGRWGTVAFSLPSQNS